MDHFHISATGHSLNYLPHYLAQERGYFTAQDLRVTVSVPEPWSRVLADLGAGVAQAALGGIWVPAMFHGRGRDFRPFAQMSNRAPLCLIARPDAAPFDWGKMAGKQIAMSGGNGASVGLYFKMVARENGVDLADLLFVQDLDNTVLVPCFLGGMGDYMMLDLPSGRKLAAQGLARIEQSFLKTGGDIPWSVYYAEGPENARALDLETRFTQAIGRAMQDLAAEPVENHRGLLSRIFSHLDPDALIALSRDYRDCGMWSGTQIDTKGLDRWQKGLKDGHLIAAPLPHAVLAPQRKPL